MNTKNPKNTSEIVESLRAAAARIGVELHQVKTAKRDGCPAFRPGGRVHLDQLRSWFAAKAATSTETPLPPLGEAELEKLGSIEASLQSAIRDEVESGRLLQRARETGDTGAVADLSRAVSVARKARLVAEAEVTKLRLERGDLLTSFEHQVQMNRTWPPIVNGLRAMARLLSTKLNQVDHTTAEQVLRDEVEHILAEAKKTLATPPDYDLHFRTWLVGILEADETGAIALQRIDAAHAEIVTAIAETQNTDVLPLKPTSK
jgi:hypothetical protein